MSRKPILTLFTTFILAIFVGLVGCSDEATPSVTAITQSEPTKLFTLMSLPTRSPEPVVAQVEQSTDVSTAEPRQSEAECENQPNAQRVRYAMDADMDWEAKTVQVEQTVTYRNDHLEPLDELVFEVEPNRLSQVNRMAFQGAFTEDGTPINGIELDALRLVVPLIEPIAVGCEGTIVLRFNINIFEVSDTNVLGYLAYTDRQLNLAHWFPTVAVYGYQVEGEWFTPERHYIGEQTIPVNADYVVDFRIRNAPQGLMMAAPGQVAPLAANHWEITLTDARDFGLSFSTQFEMASVEAGDIDVELYYFAETSAAAVERSLEDAQQAVTLYSELFGAYPHERLVVVEGDFEDGLELSGIVFVSEAWFRIWNGTLNHWLTIITVHEVGHQWWYVSVANDQSNAPYLDESLATYSELLYFERYHPDLVQEWWDFRIFQYSTDAPVDSTVYEHTQWRPYINAVYLRGVRMLQAIREVIGDEAFMAWLNDYAINNAGRIAFPVDFWRSLPEAEYLSVTEIRREYLRNGDILGVQE